MPNEGKYHRLARKIEEHKYDDELSLSPVEKDMCVNALRCYKNFKKRIAKK